MSRLCVLTGRKTTFGHNMKHRRGSSGGGGKWRFKSQKTNRTWEPNLRKVKVVAEGRIVTVKISMKAYKALRNNGSLEGIRLAVPAVK
jgi:ribosomal protein L28